MSDMYDLTMTDHRRVSELADYRGQLLLLVNVASY